jgi:DNA-binding NarL/FixJ family response regulator
VPESVTAPSGPIRVVIIDDHEMLRESVARLLEDQGDIAVVAVGASAHEAILLVGELKPDVLVIDQVLPDLTGIEVVRQLTSDDATLRAVLISGSGLTPELISAAIHAGCSDVVEKTRAVSDLAESVRRAVRNEVLMSRARLVSLASGTSPSNEAYTPRQREVLALLAEGRGSKDIADLLGLSLDSVRNHVQHLLVRFDAHSKLELLAKVRAQGLF